MVADLFCPTGIAVCIGMASTFAYANSTLREQVSLKVSHLANWPRRLSRRTTNSTGLLPDSSVDQKSTVGLSR